MASILIVCEGNVCRSPYLERVVARRLVGAGVSDVTVRSAGTHARPGLPMVDRSRDAVLRAGADPADFRSTPLDRGAIVAADLVLVLERSHRADVLDLLPAALKKTFTVREFARLAGSTVHGVAPAARPDSWQTLPALLSAARPARSEVTDDDVADPVFGDEADHAEFRERVAEAIDAIVTVAASVQAVQAVRDRADQIGHAR
jgi:protein-tyrosine phosphatase